MSSAWHCVFTCPERPRTISARKLCLFLMPSRPEELGSSSEAAACRWQSRCRVRRKTHRGMTAESIVREPFGHAQIDVSVIM